MLKVENISKTLGNFSMHDISFEVQEGDYFVLLGASGVGKTILLETLTGILRPDSGKILLYGKDITYEKIQNRNIGFVFQGQALFPHLTVRKNVTYGLCSRKYNGSEINNKLRSIAKDIEISNLLDRKPDTLSGGEAQRVALARALVVHPKCLLLDEPLSSLDISARSEMRRLLRQLNRKNITMVHVTHDYEEAISLASRIGIMENGTIVQVDTPQNIFQHPKSEFVAKFVGIKNFFSGKLTCNNGHNDRSADFITSGKNFSLLTDADEGYGSIIIRSEDVVLSGKVSQSSARNVFKGTIIDIFNARLGIEVIVDIGMEIAALVTHESVKKLRLKCGEKVFVSVKASAMKFISG